MWKIDGVIESDVCLLPMVDPGATYLISLYQHYKRGHLPYSGGVLDQPDIVMQALDLIASIVDKKD